MLALFFAALAAVPVVAVTLSLFTRNEGGFLHLAETNLGLYVANSLTLMVGVGIFSAVIGVGTAWLVASSRFAGRGFWSWMLVLPIAAPAYIIAYLYTDFLEFSGPLQTWLRDAAGLEAGSYWFPNIRSLGGATAMLGLVLYPYVYLLARASFAAQSRQQFLAARSLGLSPAQAFARVALPAGRPAIAGGIALVGMETLADFGVADYFAIPTFSTGIFRTWFALGDRIAAMQLASVLLAFVVALVFVEAASRRGGVASRDRLSSGPELFRLSSAHTVLANIACALPVILGFVLPLSLLLVNVLGNDDLDLAASLGGSLANTIALAGSTAGIAACCALLMAYAVRQSGGRAVRGAVRFATIGYALPGALLAVGVLNPLGGVDQSLTRFLRDSFGWGGGLILSGSAAILIYALTVRFLTVSYNSLSSGLGKISPSMDAAARSLGAGPLEVVRRVQIPLLAPQISVALCLVFVDVVRELPATLILRPFNFDTLATEVYRLASDERIVEASVPALAIIALGLLPVIILNRAPKALPVEGSEEASQPLN